jgi:hypothetical protein
MGIGLIGHRTGGTIRSAGAGRSALKQGADSDTSRVGGADGSAIPVDRAIRKGHTMPTGSLRIAAIAVGALLLVGGVLAASPSPVHAASGPGSGWRTVPAETVSGQNFILNSVAAPTTGAVWVAGYHWEVVGGAIEFRTLVEHFDGKKFAIVPTPDRETAPAVDFLDGISGTSASDVWAVGSSSPPGAPDQTLVEHWDGATWSIVTSPNPGNAGNILQGVAALGPRDVWAVGAEQTSATFYQRPMAIHWNGVTWTAMSLPEPTGCTGHSYLTAVSAVGHGGVWATGWCGSGGSTPQQGYVERWNGHHWALVGSYGSLPANSQLYGISATGPNDVWAVGHTQAPGSSQEAALTVHWNGVSWTQVAVTPPGANGDLHGIVARGSQPSWAVGTGSSPQPPFAGPFSVRFFGGAWHNVKVPLPFGSLAGVVVDPGGLLWAAGTHQDRLGDNVPTVLVRPLG